MEEPAWLARWAPWILAGIVLISGACRLVDFNAPPVDYANWRETQTLMQARNFYRHTMNPFKPAVDWRTTDEVAELGVVGGAEFPFVPWPTAVLYHVFGLEYWVGRVMPLLYALAGLVFFGLLARRWLGWPVALVSTTLLAASPMLFYFGRVHMPEAFVFAVSFATLYLYDRWLGSERRRDFWLAAVASALMLLAKPQMGVMALPMALMTAERWGWALFREWRLYLFAAVTAAPFLAYFAYSYLYLIPRTGLSFATNELFRFGLLAEADWYVAVGRISWYLAVEQVVCVLAVAGMVTTLWWRGGKAFSLRALFPLGWLLGAAALLFLMPGAAKVNSYYAMILAPPACLLAAHALATTFGYRFLRWGGALVLVVAVWHGVSLGYGCFRPANEVAMRCGTWVKENTAPDALVLTSVENPATLYFSDRTGWTCWRQHYGEVIVFNQTLIEQVRTLGADVVAIPDGVAFEGYGRGVARYEGIRDYLNENYRAHREKGFVVFFLEE